jgi:hypothetical protein
MSSDIDDFLRRVMERKQQKQAVPPVASPQPAPRVAPAEPMRASRESPTPAASPPLGGGIAQHVARTMDTTDVTAHVEQLGSEVALADDKLESHLHQVFDHELSSIGGRTSSETAAAALASAQAPLREALRSPETLRQAILASEVLRRPEHLWE